MKEYKVLLRSSSGSVIERYVSAESEEQIREAVEKDEVAKKYGLSIYKIIEL